ncbi:MAG: hypothetical protein Q9M39_03780 [Sulfurovum sp.]|nr:hypothetical protein [Sulfurovum sp.]
MVNGKKEYYVTIEDRLLLGIEKIITFKDRPSLINMSDQSLFYEYQYFNFDVDVPARYAMIHNEMIDRGILHAHYVNPNDYNTGFYDD